MRVAAFIPPPCPGGGNGVREPMGEPNVGKPIGSPRKDARSRGATCAMRQPRPSTRVGKSQRMLEMLLSAGVQGGVLCRPPMSPRRSDIGAESGRERPPCVPFSVAPRTSRWGSLTPRSELKFGS